MLKTKIKFIFLLFLILQSCSTNQENQENTTITLLILYANQDSTRFGNIESEIKNRFKITQSVFDNSKTNVKFEIAKIVGLDFQSESRILDLKSLLDTNDGILDSAHILRKKTRSDNFTGTKTATDFEPIGTIQTIE